MSRAKASTIMLFQGEGHTCNLSVQSVKSVPIITIEIDLVYIAHYKLLHLLSNLAGICAKLLHFLSTLYVIIAGPHSVVFVLFLLYLTAAFTHYILCVILVAVS